MPDQPEPKLDPKPARNSPDYPKWVNNRLRAEITRRREALEKTPYSMAIPHVLSAQTIRNIEDGTHSPTMTTLALLCPQLEAEVEELILAALL